MAKLNRVKESEVREYETFKVDLSEEEQSAFRADPHAFLRDLIEGEGYKVNRLVIDLAECPDGHQLAHALGPPGVFSNWVWECILPP